MLRIPRSATAVRFKRVAEQLYEMCDERGFWDDDEEYDDMGWYKLDEFWWHGSVREEHGVEKNYPA